MIEISLNTDEVGSLAYVQFGEIIASYRSAKPTDVLKRMERCFAHVSHLAQTGQDNTPSKTRPAGKRESIKLEFDELQSLIHDRLTALRKTFYAKAWPAVATEFSRVIELHREYVKASRLAATGRAA